MGCFDKSIRLSTLAQSEGAQRATKHPVPEVRRPLPQDESKNRQVQCEPNAQYRQHGGHGRITILKAFGSRLRPLKSVAVIALLTASSGSWMQSSHMQRVAENDRLTRCTRGAFRRWQARQATEQEYNALGSALRNAEEEGIWPAAIAASRFLMV
jgi:hypothetical protein